MGKQLSRREFVKGAGMAIGAGVVAGGIGAAFDDLVAVGDLDELAGEVDSSPVPVPEGWPKPREDEDRQGDLFRACAVGMRVYPPCSLEDPAFNAMVASIRAELLRVLEELDRADLYALFQVVKILALYPPAPSFFETANGIYARHRA